MKKITLLFLFIFLASSVTAYNPFKWQICGGANMTGGNCDDYWEEFKGYVGIPNETTATTNNSFIEENYLNKSQMEDLFLNKTEIVLHFANKTDIENIANLLADLPDYDAKINEVRVNLEGQIVSIQNQKEDGGGNSIFYILGAALVLVVGYTYHKNVKGAKNSQDVNGGAAAPPTSTRPAPRRILPSTSLELENKIKKLEEESSKAEQALRQKQQNAAQGVPAPAPQPVEQKEGDGVSK